VLSILQDMMVKLSVSIKIIVVIKYLIRPMYKWFPYLLCFVHFCMSVSRGSALYSSKNYMCAVCTHTILHRHTYACTHVTTCACIYVYHTANTQGNIWTCLRCVRGTFRTSVISYDKLSGVTRSMVIPGPETEVIGESGSGGLCAPRRWERFNFTCPENYLNCSISKSPLMNDLTHVLTKKFSLHLWHGSKKYIVECSSCWWFK